MKATGLEIGSQTFDPKQLIQMRQAIDSIAIGLAAVGQIDDRRFRSRHHRPLVLPVQNLRGDKRGGQHSAFQCMQLPVTRI
jgi:hypothetical protein